MLHSVSYKCHRSLSGWKFFFKSKKHFYPEFSNYFNVNLFYHLDVHSLKNFTVKLYMIEDYAPFTQILDLFLSHTFSHFYMLALRPTISKQCFKIMSKDEKNTQNSIVQNSKYVWWEINSLPVRCYLCKRYGNTMPYDITLRENYSIY